VPRSFGEKGKMVHPFEKNRRALVFLINKMGRFREEELVEQFIQERRGDIALDGGQSIKQYLDELVEIGALDLSGGVYSAY